MVYTKALKTFSNVRSGRLTLFLLSIRNFFHISGNFCKLPDIFYYLGSNIGLGFAGALADLSHIHGNVGHIPKHGQNIFVKIMLFVSFQIK